MSGRRAVDGHRHGDDEKICFRKIGSVRGIVDRRADEILEVDLSRAVAPPRKFGDPAGVDVEAYGACTARREGNRDRQPDATKTNDANLPGGDRIGRDMNISFGVYDLALFTARFPQ